MIPRVPLVLVAGSLLALLPGASPTRSESSQTTPTDQRADLERAHELLAKAIALRYDCDSRARIDLRMRDARGGERRRRIEIVSKRLEGRLHSIGRLLAPQHLRGMTILSIEAPDRADDVFVYLPSLGRARRVSMGRRSDSFLGSDLSYDDFERHRAEDYEVESLSEETVAGELAHVITTRPRNSEAYRRTVFVAALSDLAMLELRYHKDAAADPFRVVRFPRASIRSVQGRLIPTRIRVENTLLGSETEVEISDLEINPEIDDRLFSITTLEAERAFWNHADARERTPAHAR